MREPGRWTAGYGAWDPAKRQMTEDPGFLGGACGVALGRRDARGTDVGPRPRRVLRGLTPIAGSPKNIMQGLDDLIANAKNTNPKTLEAYYVVVHLQGHAFPTVAANSIGDALKGVAKPDQPQIAFRAAEAKLDTSNLGLILAYELQSKLTELASALAALEGNGAKTYLIVNIDCCWAERFFDGWGGGAGKAKLPGNIYGGWSAGTDSKSKVEGSANGANLTPFTQGFDGALGLDDDGRQKSATVQDAQKAGADKANDAGDKPAKNASDVKTGPPQGAGSAAPGGAAPVDPGAHGKGI